MSFPAFHGITAAAGGGTPLDYGDDLIFFLDAENGITATGENVTQWTDQGADAIDFDRPSGDSDPHEVSSYLNGLPAIEFVDPSAPSVLNKRLASSDANLDNIFSGAGDKTLAFAALNADRFIDDTFSVQSVMAEKGTNGSGSNRNGWQLKIDGSGSLIFEHQRDSGSTPWRLTASGFYSIDDPIIGYLIYDGGNSSGSGTFFLHNGSSFVETGTVTTGSSSTIGSDSDADFNVGNNERPSTGFNSPFQGGISAMWMTKPARTSLDQGYLSRWIA